MPPGELVGGRIGLDGAAEVDVVALLKVLGVHHAAQGQLHARGDWKKNVSSEQAKVKHKGPIFSKAWN